MVKRSSWHEDMVDRVGEVGRSLGFRSKVEEGVRGGRGRIDCVWCVDEPILEYLVAFEFETATSGAQIVENLIKVLSIPPQIRPRFLIQIYRDRIRSRRVREHVERIAGSLPVATRIVDGVGVDIDKAVSKVMVELFNWIGRYASFSERLVERLRKILPGRVTRIFHYGEPRESHLEYLDGALSSCRDRIACIVSIPTRKVKPGEFDELEKFDVVIISDVPPRNVDFEKLKEYIERKVKNGGKLILTGGYGLTKGYNVLEEYLGGVVGSRCGRKVEVSLEELGVEGTLTFRGFNRFTVRASDVEVIARWSFGDYPALARRRIGGGEIILFTSDCSPAWGSPSIEEPTFKEMWRKLVFT